MRRIVYGLLAVMAVFFVCVTAGSARAAEIKNGTKSAIDVENRNDGYIRVRMTAQSDKQVKVRTILDKKDGTKAEYTYDLNGNCDWESYPLQSGNGSYTIQVLQNVEGTRYTVIQTTTANAKYKTEHAPFLVPVQNVNYSPGDPAVQKAAELCEPAASDLEKVEAVYGYIVETMEYDYSKASQITTGQIKNYLPTISDTLDSKKGICFDFSSLMAAMLRSQGVPVKLAMGYVTTKPAPIYHAWNEVYIKEIGWVKIRSSVYFDGTDWSRMDATFAAGNERGANTELMEKEDSYQKDKEF